MFGMKPEEVAKLVEAKVEVLREDVENRFRRINSPPNAKELAQEALRELLLRVDPKEFLENLLASKGLTLEGLVRKSVNDFFQNSEEGSFSEAMREEIAGNVADRLWDELDMSAVQDAVAVHFVRFFEDKEQKGELVEEIAAKVAEDIDLDEDDMHRAIGESVVRMLRKET